MHGAVGVFPVGEHTDALEFARLHIRPFLSKGAAGLTEADRVSIFGIVAALGAKVFFDLPFDRQAVAVPARHQRRVIAQHLVAAADDIFQRLCENMAEVDIAVRKRRAVVQNKFLEAF